VDRGVKQEEIPRDITFPDIKSEPDEHSTPHAVTLRLVLLKMGIMIPETC